MIEQRIANDTGLQSGYVQRVMRSAGHRYKTYPILKRDGGTRWIHHPAREVKLIQRWLVANIFCELPIHDCVLAYRKGKSIRDLAERHARDSYLLRVDFKEFFPSIKGSDVVSLLSSNPEVTGGELSSEDLELIRSAVCRNNRLTVGAPSSPVLSNAMLLEFDRSWGEHCNRAGVKYSRYADDLYFSTSKSGSLSPLYLELQTAVANLERPKLQLNEGKTRFSSKKNRRVIAGLILASDGKVSLGRTKKRFVRGLVNKYVRGNLAPEEIQYLSGYLSFARSIEPEFPARLRKKYGSEVVSEIENYSRDDMGDVSESR